MIRNAAAASGDNTAPHVTETPSVPTGPHYFHLPDSQSDPESAAHITAYREVVDNRRRASLPQLIETIRTTKDPATLLSTLETYAAHVQEIVDLHIQHNNWHYAAEHAEYYAHTLTFLLGIGQHLQTLQVDTLSTALDYFNNGNISCGTFESQASFELKMKIKNVATILSAFNAPSISLQFVTITKSLLQLAEHCCRQAGYPHNANQLNLKVRAITLIETLKSGTNDAVTKRVDDSKLLIFS